jgi:hypothetical protein
MDFIAHLLWSGIIFIGPQVILACFCGVLPDLAAFGVTLIYFPLRHQHLNWRTEEGREAIRQMTDRWVLKLYFWTHSLVVWGTAIGIGTIIWSFVGGEFPWFLFAGVIHICIDIPTHSIQFFAPAFLTPLSKYRFDGWSWANKKFMLVNYALIITCILLRLIQFKVI